MTFFQKNVSFCVTLKKNGDFLKFWWLFFRDFEISKWPVTLTFDSVPREVADCDSWLLTPEKRYDWLCRFLIVTIFFTDRFADPSTRLYELLLYLIPVTKTSFSWLIYTSSELHEKRTSGHRIRTELLRSDCILYQVSCPIFPSLLLFNFSPDTA